MAPVAILASVITKLRCLTYNFLWSGCSDHTRQHLCNWESLAKPKHKGGWGLCNTYHFSKALVANSLWHVLNTPNIWHSIIKEKYLSQHTISSWLLTDTVATRVTSFFLENSYKFQNLDHASDLLAARFGPLHHAWPQLHPWIGRYYNTSTSVGSPVTQQKCVAPLPSQILNYLDFSPRLVDL